MKKQTHQEILRKSLKFRILRKIWVKAGRLSRRAGKKIIALSREADKKDYEESENQ